MLCSIHFFALADTLIMPKTLEVKLTAGEAERIEATITKCDEALIRLFKRMRKDQAEIEKLKAQTRAILAEMKAA